MTNNEASELISCLKTYRGDISSDEFVELVLATHKSLEEVVHDSDESVDSLPELAADKKSVESEAVAIPTVIPTPKPGNLRAICVYVCCNYCSIADTFCSTS